MPHLDFKLLSVVRALDGGGDNDGGRGRPLLLAEGLLFPEVCCLDAREPRVRVTLRDAVKHVVEEMPPVELHRRAVAGEPAVGEVTVELEPPARSVAWAEPVTLRFHVVRWRHGEDAFVAFVPALGIEVAAAKEDELDRLVPEHVRFALRREKVAGSLYRLALLGRTREVRLEPIELGVTVKDPKQVVQERGRADEAKPVIEEVGTVLSAGDAAPEPAYEIDALVSVLAEALGGRSPQSVLLLGPSGVGKTAAVRELVRTRAARGLGDTPFWSTSGSRLVAGMSGFGMWQQRTGRLVREAGKAGAVLHLGSLVELMEVGRGTLVGQGIASFLRPYVGRGDVLAVAECTPEQLPVIEREDPHLLAVFRQVKVDEPAPAAGRMILLNAALARAGKGGEPPISEAGLDALDRLHRRYAGYSAYPGRPLRFLNNLLRDHHDRTKPWDVAVDGVVVAMVERPAAAPISAPDVTAAFARETGLPAFMLDEAAPLDLAASREWFAGRVIGQTEAVDLVVNLLASVKAALNRPRRPVASLLFIGPTGVGKTEMAKTLAEFFFGDKARVSRFDMSEYASPADVARLAGGVFGSEGLLTAKVREQPFSVVLLDEFEKADASFFDLLLQVLGEGRLTDAAGRVADFSNAIVIMTSNLGAETFQRGRFGLSRGGDGASTAAADHARSHFVEAVRDFVRPELFNRIDRVVPFLPLDRATILAVTRRELGLVAARDGAKLRGVEVDVSERAVAHLADRGFDARYGARPLKRAIERELLVPLAEAVNTYPEQIRLVASVDAANGKLDVTVRARVEAGGRQSSALASGSTTAELARRATDLRRAVQRVERSAAVLSLRNEVFRLEEAERRQQARARAKREHAGHDPVRGARLKRLTAITESVARVAGRSVTIEDALLRAIYDDEGQDARRGHGDAVAAAADMAGELDALGKEKDGLPLALYALQFDRPDRATVALYCDHHRPLLRLARAYRDVALLLGGEVRVFQPQRSKKKAPLRPPPVPAPPAGTGPGGASAAAPPAPPAGPPLEVVPVNDPAAFLTEPGPELLA
jgi:ATP-dependent Clp protease ATP-binding subunit ClpA